MSIRTAPLDRALCKRDNMSCFANTALQTMAHLSCYRRLFDPSHILKRLPSETEEQFAARKQLQIIGNDLLYQILSGKEKASGVRNFLAALHLAHPNFPSAEKALNSDDSSLITLSVKAVLMPMAQKNDYQMEEQLIDLFSMQSTNVTMLKSGLNQLTSLKEFKYILSPSHQLHRLPNESEEHFSKRLHGQSLLLDIIPRLKSRENITQKMEALYQTLYELNPAVLPPLTLRMTQQNRQQLISCAITEMLFPSEQKQLYKDKHPSESLAKPSQWPFNDITHPKYCPPPAYVQFRSFDEKGPPLSLDLDGGVYELELATTTGGHATTLIREDDHHFVQLDDLQQKPKKITIENGADLNNKYTIHQVYYKLTLKFTR